MRVLHWTVTANPARKAFVILNFYTRNDRRNYFVQFTDPETGKRRVLVTKVRKTEEDSIFATKHDWRGGRGIPTSSLETTVRMKGSFLTQQILTFDPHGLTMQVPPCAVRCWYSRLPFPPVVHLKTIGVFKDNFPYLDFGATGISQIAGPSKIELVLFQQGENRF